MKRGGEQIYRGLLVDFFSPQQLAAEIVQLLAQPDRLRAQRLQARRDVEQHFDLAQRTLPRLIRLVEELAERRG